MSTNTKISNAAAALGRKGGSAKSESKTTTARANGAKGGRPRTNVLQGRRRSTIPGDTEMVLTQDATDNDGKVWSVGSIYQPLSTGMMGDQYQRVSIRDNAAGSMFKEAVFFMSAQS